MAKVLVTEQIHPDGMELLKNAGHEVIFGNITKANDEENLIKLFEDVDAALVRFAEITDKVIANAKNLKIISKHGVGIDNFDQDAMKKKGVALTVTPGANSLAVAEHAFALLIALSKNLSEVSQNYRTEGLAARNGVMGYTITGKTLGILGYGRIGRYIGDMAMKGFGMKVIVYDPFIPRNDERVTYVDDPEDLLKESDFVTLHLGLTDDTRHMISDHQFDIMKENAILINCARGPIIDEQALIRALQEGKIHGAGLDVTEEEPCNPDSPLFKMKNVILTPHYAPKTHECESLVASTAAENIINFLNNDEVVGRII